MSGGRVACHERTGSELALRLYRDRPNMSRPCQCVLDPGTRAAAALIEQLNHGIQPPGILLRMTEEEGHGHALPKEGCAVPFCII